MIIKIFKPFWSYDVQKTEDWLASMAQKGYELIRINRLTRYFYFQQVESNVANYRIVFDKVRNPSLSKGLLNFGWTKVLQSGKWVVTMNRLPLEQIRTFPDREGIVKHNKKIMYIFTGILIYLMVAFLNVILISAIAMSVSKFNHFNVFSGPYGFIPATALGLSVILCIFTVYSLITLNKTNKRITEEFLQPSKSNGQVTPLQQIILSKNEEKRLKNSGQLVMKWKPGWMYAPDRLEAWLEGMEEKGYNLYKVGKTGAAFYFIKGKPRKVCYCADLQNTADTNYFNIHMESGWACLYKSSSWTQRWVVWGQEYVPGEAKPQIYSDKLNQLKLARRIALTYSAMFLPLIIVYTYTIVINIKLLTYSNLDRLQLINLILFAILILMFGSYVSRTWLYYNRLRKHHL
ncbi:hypothetical protein R50345_14595 [Paenibacillus sp. FSL R5-0345]|uniref:DUF2812 domain-containing protein n=1 Tax=Paenibacillus sp. FSL R5-0345 TaxID=1536770 RepID=UPI0004F6567A|nr:DUF2812 domain-containing protein [Paenibacillus sp. FSL R5-0345]AIQ35741.1 hypothetical protein R50345_14595 [Paenibacillus sp. FSL R5-0345]